MKKIFTLGFVCFLLMGMAVGQIPNFSFESWTGNNPDPANWFTYNNPYSPYIFITKSTNPCSGNFAAKSTIIWSGDTGIYITAPLRTGTFSSGYIPISNKPDELHGCYLFSRPSGGISKFNVNVNLKSDTTIIGSGSFTDSINELTYQNFIVSINYNSNLIPDSVSIQFDFGLSGPFDINDFGAYYIVDSLSFQETVGVDNLPNKESITIYPNPATSTITLHSQLPALQTQLIITDVLGNEVYHQTINTTTQSTINISQWSDGVYFYSLTPAHSKGEGDVLRGKFVKE